VTWQLLARSRVSKKASHRGHGGHRGGTRKGKMGWWHGSSWCEIMGFLRKHRTEVTEATEGELENGKGAGDMAAPGAISRVSRKASHRGHRGHRGKRLVQRRGGRERGDGS
jgi:hypothetical protein